MVLDENGRLDDFVLIETGGYMAPTFNDTHQPRVINGWTISKRDNVWQAVNKHGEVVHAHVDEQRVIGLAKKGNANQKLT